MVFISVMPSFLNKAIDKLPFPIHIPSYKYCGPGSILSIDRPPKNDLDRACQIHDYSYRDKKDLPSRHEADKLLADTAWDIFKSKKSKFAERAVALGVSTIMKAKRKLGLGYGTFNGLVKTIHTSIKNKKPKNLIDTAKLAYSIARKHHKKIKAVPRIISLEKKTGGLLPILPILATLSAIGALSGGASSIVNTVKRAQEATKELEETKRHNKTIEAIHLGSGLFLKSYRKGYGLFLSPYKKKGGDLKKRKSNKKKNFKK